MINEEGLPALRGWAPGLRHVLRNRGLPDINAELEQLAVDGGVLESGFAMLISRIRSRISTGVLGRPPRGRDFQRQWALNPARCQRSTVSGLTTFRAYKTWGTRVYMPANTSRSMLEKAKRPGDLRRRTFSWCRSTRISASSAARDRKRPAKAHQISLQRSIIAASINRFARAYQPSLVSGRDNDQLLPKRSILGFKPALGLEERGYQVQGQEG